MIDWLLRPRPPAVLLCLALFVGIVHALTMVPFGLIAGTSSFWDYPRGTVPGSLPDYAEVYDGYLHFQQDGWHWPLLRIAHINPPDGTNIIWLDGLPLVCLLGKIVYSLTGLPINLLGAYQFLCFALTGCATAGALIAFGVRHFAAILAGALVASALPFHLYEFGHIPLTGQFVIPLAFALYGFSVRSRPTLGAGVWWFLLLVVALLSNAYLFVMTGAIWGATILQRWLNGQGIGRLAAEALPTVGLTVAIMFVTGMAGSGARSTGAFGFGVYSLNLLGPLLPQKSGVIPPLAEYLVGNTTQVFGCVGVGVLVLCAAAIWKISLRKDALRSHAALLAVLGGCYLFALSYRLTFGSHVLLELPLPEALIFKLGTLRASGRFFWPVGFALLIGSIAIIASRYRPATATAILLAAGLLQWIDIGPIRDAIAQTATVPIAPAIDRQQATALAADVSQVMLFPTYGCLPQIDVPTPENRERNRWMAQAIMEFHLIAARRDLPINSVNSGRPNTDCDAEAVQRGQPLQSGRLYVYFNPPGPDSALLGGRPPEAICRQMDRIIVCKP